jgi:DNA-binding IclR family transcriptional regulator
MAVMEPASDPGPGKRTAASRVLAVLGAFSHGNGALTLAEISRHADLPLSTAHRLTHEVLDWGGLELDASGKYRLSRKILDLASSSTRELRLRETALSHLVELHRFTGLTVHLAVRDRGDVTYIEALRPHVDYTGENRIGGRLPLHVTSTGIVLLAHTDPAFVDDYLSRPLKRFTEHTPTDPDAIRRMLDDVRRRRHAVLQGSIAPRVGSISAPVPGADGTVETVVGMVYLMDEVDHARLIGPINATAARISRALTERPASPAPQTVDFNRRNAGLV